MKLREPKKKDTWLRRVARSYRELILLAAIVTGAIIAGFVLYPYAVAAWKVIVEQFVVNIRHAIGG